MNEKKTSAVPVVCPVLFTHFFRATTPSILAAKENPHIPESRRESIVLKIALSFALELFGDDLAVPFALRLLSFSNFLDSGGLVRVGGNLIIENAPGEIEVSGVAAMAAAYAELTETALIFSIPEFAVAVLELDDGCPKFDCPNYETCCTIPAPAERSST